MNVTKLFLHHNMYDIVFICYQDGDYSIHIFHTTSNSYCSRPNILILVSTCSRYRRTKKFLFQKRNKSLWNCRFKFITRIAWPFTHSDSAIKLGINQRILKSFEKYEEILIEQHPMSSKTDKYGRVISNVAAMLKRVEDKEFEGAIGGLLLKLKRTERLSFAYPVIINSEVAVLAKADDLGPWEGVLKQMPLTALLMGIPIIVLSVAASVITIFPCQQRDITRDILLVLGYILNKTNVVNIHP